MTEPLGNQWRMQDSPDVGALTLRGCEHTIWLNSPKTCMKLKEFASPPPLDLPMVIV